MENKQSVYFDNAASTPIFPEVLEEINRVNSEIYGNPSASHAMGRKAKIIIENSRKVIAKCLGANVSEIIFTSCGTESDNLTIINSVKYLGIEQIITSKIEHKAVLYTAMEQARLGNCQIQYVNLLENGHIDFSHLTELLDTNKKTLVSLMHGNNEIGNLLDLEKTSELCKQHKALFHTDGVQTIGHIPIDLSKINIDFMASSAHKFNGPKGVGFLYVNKKHNIENLMFGGTQERGKRPGTENITGIAGMAVALSLNIDNLSLNYDKLLNIKNHFIQELKDKLPGISFNGDYNGQCNPTVLSITLPPTAKDSTLLFHLDLNGICISAGSACNSGANIGSPVMQALYPDKVGVTLRFSFGHQNTIQEVDYTIGILQNIVQS